MEACAYCVKYEERHQPPPPSLKKGEVFFFVCRCDCLLILERVMVAAFPLVSPLDPLSLSPVSRRTHVNPSSHLREAQAFGCDNDLQETTNGERTCRTHTHTHTHTDDAPSTPLLRWAISTLISSPHTAPAADWGGTNRHNGRRGELSEGIASLATQVSVGSHGEWAGRGGNRVNNSNEAVWITSLMGWRGPRCESDRGVQLGRTFEKCWGGGDGSGMWRGSVEGGQFGEGGCESV